MNTITACAPVKGFIGAIPTPYGKLSVNRGDATNCASMHAAQLSSLLLLIQSDDCEAFHTCSKQAQTNLLWLAVTMAEKLESLLPLIAADERDEAKVAA